MLNFKSGQGFFRSCLGVFRRGLWDRLPLGLRRRALGKIFGALAPRVARNQPVRAPYYVAGLLSSSVGIGEGARLCIDGMRAVGFPVVGIDLSSIFGRGGLESADQDGGWIELGPGTIIVHLNPDQLPFALFMIGRNRLQDKRIVGYWSWELCDIPEVWHKGFAFVDEIWVPSEFVLDAVSRHTDKPVHVMPHPVAVREPGKPDRARFGIADNLFVVTSIFDMASCFERKNPISAVRGFRCAFGDALDALLIVKVTGGETEPVLFGQLRDAIGNAPNIRLLTSKFERTEMCDFISSVDVVLSAHRSEGFGLSLAEAMHSGTVVVATGWSGNMEFMDAESAELLPFDLIPVLDPQGCYSKSGECWADPDVAELAATLKRLAVDRMRMERLRRAGQLFAADRLGTKAYRQSLELMIGI